MKWLYLAQFSINLDDLRLVKELFLGGTLPCLIYPRIRTRRKRGGIYT